MYVVVNHHITDPEKFWGILGSNPAMPEGFKVKSVFPGNDSSKAVCIWQAPGVAAFEKLINSTVGSYSRNTYMEVNESKAMGF